MKKVTLGITLITNLILITMLYFYSQDKIFNLNEQNKQKHIGIINECIRHDSIMFKIKQNLPVAIPVILNMIDSVNNKDILFVFIPNSACWTCNISKIKNIMRIKESYSINIVFIGSYSFLRNMKIIFPNERYLIPSDIITEYNGAVIDGSNSLLFVIYNRLTKNFIPYYENKFYEPINFIIHNYYENYN